MSRKLLIAFYTVAFIALIAAYPLPHNDRRDLSSFDEVLFDRAMDSLDYEYLERRDSRKSRKAASAAKGIVKVPKPHTDPLKESGLKGADAKKFLADAKAAKNQVKNDNRNANLAKAGHGPVTYAASNKGIKDANTKKLKAEQRADDQMVHGIKTAGRPPKSKTEIAREKTEHKAHLAVAKDEHAKSLATGTFPARDAQFKTAKGNVFTGKDVRQADFTAHLAAQKPVGYKLSDGSSMKTKDRHPKEFQNREQGPAGAKSKPLPALSGGDKYREFGIVQDKVKGYDGRSPNPTEARLITKHDGAGGVHEFAAVVAHPNSAGPDKNDHHVVHPT